MAHAALFDLCSKWQGTEYDDHGKPAPSCAIERHGKQQQAERAHGAFTGEDCTASVAQAEASNKMPFAMILYVNILRYQADE